MAVVLRLGIGSNISLFCNNLNKISIKCTPNILKSVSAVRFYKGSSRYARRREWNKKMERLKRDPPRKFDYKLFISENYEKELNAFAHRLGVNPDNANLRAALTHKTFVQNAENDTVDNHNAKLAVLGLNITSQFIIEYLFFTYQKFPTSLLRTLQEYLLSPEILVKVSTSCSIPELIRTPVDLISLEKNTSKNEIIADSMLALIASIYVDEGYSQARAFVHDFLLVELHGKELEQMIKFKNSDKLLEAVLLEQNKEKPIARIISSSTKYTHNPSYVVGVFSSEILLGKGVSYSLQKARGEAYSIALTKFLNSNITHTMHLPSSKEVET